MRKGYQYKSEESANREKAHWFGQPSGNKIGEPSAAANQREFYRWCECVATDEDLREYVQNKKNPIVRRRFVSALMKCERVQDFFDLSNQTHGQPKQRIEQTNLPEVKIVLE